MELVCIVESPTARHLLEDVLVLDALPETCTYSALQNCRRQVDSYSRHEADEIHVVLITSEWPHGCAQGNRTLRIDRDRPKQHIPGLSKPTSHGFVPALCELVLRWCELQGLTKVLEDADQLRLPQELD